MSETSSLKVIFTCGKNIGSPLIRFLTWSPWSHVAILDGDYVVEASYPRVRRTPFKDYNKNHDPIEVCSFSCPDPQAAICFANQQVGKPYDFIALLGFLFHRNWADVRQWFCSELVACALEKGGRKLFRDELLTRVTPQHLWMIGG